MNLKDLEVKRNFRLEKLADDLLNDVIRVADEDDVLHIWKPNPKEKKILREIEVDEKGNVLRRKK